MTHTLSFILEFSLVLLHNSSPTTNISISSDFISGTDSGNLMRFFFFLVTTKRSLSSVFVPHLSIIMGFFQGFCCLLIKVKRFLVTQLVGMATVVVDKAYLRDQVALLEFNFCCSA